MTPALYLLGGLCALSIVLAIGGCIVNFVIVPILNTDRWWTLPLYLAVVGPTGALVMGGACFIVVWTLTSMGVG